MPTTPRSRHGDRKSTRLNSSHLVISYAVFCLKKKKDHHYTVASENLKGAAVFDDYLTDSRTVATHQGHHIFRVRTFREAGKAAQVSFFNDTPTTEIYTLSLHAALPI